MLLWPPKRNILSKRRTYVVPRQHVERPLEPKLLGKLHQSVKLEKRGPTQHKPVPLRYRLKSTTQETGKEKTKTSLPRETQTSELSYQEEVSLARAYHLEAWLEKWTPK